MMNERQDNRGGMQSERDRERRGDASRDPITKTSGARPVGMSAGAATGLENYIGYDVVDRDEEKIGRLDCLWSDHTGQAAFLGVRTGWIFGRTHVVPAHGTHASQSGNRIRLPYSVQKVKDAPAYDADEAITPDREREVYAYYGVTGTSQQPTTTRRRSESGRETADIDLVEEQVKIGKRQVEAGGVRLRKIVRTETVNQPVELRREEAVIERVPGQGQPAGKAFEGEDIYIPLRREEAVVQKEAAVREQVRVRKTGQTERQNVREQVRREDVEVEGTGEAENRIHGAETGPAAGIRERQENPRSKRQ